MLKIKNNDLSTLLVDKSFLKAYHISVNINIM